MSSQESKDGLLPQGLYERLVYADETVQLDALADAHRALIDEPSESQRREHLIREISSRLPELLDEVASVTDGKAEQARAELKLIAHLLREARLQTSTSSDLRLPAEPIRVLRALHAPNAPSEYRIRYSFCWQRQSV